MKSSLGVDLKYLVMVMKWTGLFDLTFSPIVNILYILYAWFYIIIVGFNIVSELTYVFLNDIDLPSISEAVTVIASFMKTFLLSVRFRMVQKKIQNLVKMMDQIKLNRKHLNMSEDKILFEADRESKILTLAIFIPHLIFVMYMNAVPLTMNNYNDHSSNSTESLHLQFKGWFPFDSSHGFKYAIAYLSQTVGICIALMQVTVFETFCISVMIHISAEFAIVYNNFLSLIDSNSNYIHIGRKLDSQEANDTSQSEMFPPRFLQISETSIANVAVAKINSINIHHSSPKQYHMVEPVDTNPENVPENVKQKMSLEESDNANDSEDEYYNRLIQCITHHQNILNFGEETNEVLGMFLFLEIIVIILALCVSTFVASLPNVDSHVRVKSISYTITLTTQLLLPCWYGQRVIDQSERIKHAVYGCNWYEMSPRFRKALAFVIMRTHRPILFSIGGFSSASRETWLSLINFTYSMLAILRQMNEK